jgi:hypothetical protein
MQRTGRKDVPSSILLTWAAKPRVRTILRLTPFDFCDFLLPVQVLKSNYVASAPKVPPHDIFFGVACSHIGRPRKPAGSN